MTDVENRSKVFILKFAKLLNEKNIVLSVSTALVMSFTYGDIYHRIVPYPSGTILWKAGDSRGDWIFDLKDKDDRILLWNYLIAYFT